ncbi:MAG: ribonuclease H-like domain-containing protein [Candidatus Woesearchaeota archaeon]|nr:ribonuclease H-like domain-containing protein [Candidatus Woesearchaeota archaeon]
MLDESFIFLPGIREKTERKLWDAEMHTWDHLLDAKAIQGVGKPRLSFWKAQLRELQLGPKELKSLLGTRYTWRAHKQIMDNPRFVDIETTEYGEITVLGVSDGEFYQGFIQGRNMDRHEIARVFADATCIVTFNGASFDLPIIARQVHGVLPDVPHLDMRHICAQAGLRGGLKHIEKVLNLRRADAIREIDGGEAIYLWHSYKAGREEALRELVDYNAADVLNLAPLVDLVIPKLWRYVRYGEPLVFEQKINIDKFK